MGIRERIREKKRKNLGKLRNIYGTFIICLVKC